MSCMAEYLNKSTLMQVSCPAVSVTAVAVLRSSLVASMASLLLTSIQFHMGLGYEGSLLPHRVRYNCPRNARQQGMLVVGTKGQKPILRPSRFFFGHSLGSSSLFHDVLQTEP